MLTKHWSFFFKLNNLPPCLNFFLVRQSLKGYKRHNFTKDRRLPITPALLEKLCSITGQVCFSSFEAVLFRAVFSLMFFAALRVSELDIIQLSDVFISDAAVRLFIRRSKTDQMGKGAWVNLSACNGSPLCPVKLLCQYAYVRPRFPNKFFIHESGRPLTIFQFNSVFHKMLKGSQYEYRSVILSFF